MGKKRFDPSTPSAPAALELVVGQDEGIRKRGRLGESAESLTFLWEKASTDDSDRSRYSKT